MFIERVAIWLFWLIPSGGCKMVTPCSPLFFFADRFVRLITTPGYWINVVVFGLEGFTAWKVLPMYTAFKLSVDPRVCDDNFYWWWWLVLPLLLLRVLRCWNIGVKLWLFGPFLVALLINFLAGEWNLLSLLSLPLGDPPPASPPLTIVAYETSPGIWIWFFCRIIMAWLAVFIPFILLAKFTCFLVNVGFLLVMLTEGAPTPDDINN